VSWSLGWDRASNQQPSIALIEALRHPAPLEEAVRVLEAEWGIAAACHGRVIDVIGGVRGDPLTAALRAVGLA
jgi:hypothetical protein